MSRWMMPVVLGVLFLASAPGCRRDEAPADAPAAADPAAARAAAAALADCEIEANRVCVAKHLDLDAKARDLFGARYEAAVDADRGATRTMLLDLFMAAGPSLRRRHFKGGVGAWQVASADADRAVVLEEGDGLRLEYLVARSEAGWRVVDRIRIKGAHRADPKVLVEKFLRDFEKESGRAATLADVNEKLPAFVGSHRARTLRIPGKGRGRSTR
jgi:hypothetical protein